MSAMSEPPPRELASLSVEELRAALGRQRAVNTELRAVLPAQAELHQAELAARDAQLAQLRPRVAATDAQIVELRSQVVVLGERVAQLEGQAGRDSSNSSKPPSSDSPYTKTGRKPGKQPARRASPWRRWLPLTTRWCAPRWPVRGVAAALPACRLLPSTPGRCSRPHRPTAPGRDPVPGA